ncbi:MAG: hypothetical protein M1591_01055 [Deltaproteobacteria bacterium]|nr:hypothetical protein [Deltaproteobacteria bacterium]
MKKFDMFSKVDKTAFSVGTLNNEIDNRDYWLSKSPKKRLQASDLYGKHFMAIPALPQDFKEFLKLLNSPQLKYLLTDGYAMGDYGHPCATADMDV